MLCLPKTLPTQLRLELEACFRAEPLMGEAIRKSVLILAQRFQAQDAIIAVSFSGLAEDQFVSATTRAKVAADYEEQLLYAWIESGVHIQVLKELQAKLAPVSYSRFSWLFHNTLNSEKVPELRFPREYTLFVPFSSDLIIHQEKERKFSGYLSFMLDQFLEINDEILLLVTMLPGLLSEIFATLQREQNFNLTTSPSVSNVLGRLEDRKKTAV